MNAPFAGTWEGPLTLQDVSTQIVQALFGPLTKQTPAEETLRAEILRMAIWEQSILSQPPSLEKARVSTQQILRRARLLWQPISLTLKKTASSSEALFEREEDLSRRMLDSLAEQGDLFALPGGQWLPAPLRLVPITPDRYLLVGGIPGSLLAREIFQKLHLHGSFRQINVDLVQKHPPFDAVAEPWQFQTQEHWLGKPPLPLKDLLQQFREIDLYPQTIQHTADAYIASCDKPQSQRWQPLEKVLRDGQYLLRSQNLWGQRSYTVGSIRNRQLQQQSQKLESWDIRRLCYALDDEAHTPTSVTWNKQEGILTLKSELPARVRRYLATLGRLQTNGTGYYYPRIWRISPRYEQDIQAILSELAIAIQ